MGEVHVPLPVFPDHAVQAGGEDIVGRDVVGFTHAVIGLVPHRVLERVGAVAGPVRVGGAVVAQRSARGGRQEGVVAEEVFRLAVHRLLHREEVVVDRRFGVRGLGEELDVVRQAVAEAAERGGVGRVAEDRVVAGARASRAAHGDRGLAGGNHALEHRAGDAGLAELIAIDRTGQAEAGAAGRTGDLAGHGVVGLAGLLGIGDGYRAVAACVVGAQKPEADRAVIPADAVLLGPGGGTQDVRTAGEQRHAGGEFLLVLEAVGIHRDTGVGVVLHTGEVLVENEVGHAGDGVGTVHGRGAAGDHVNAGNQRLGENGDVDRAVLAGDRHAHAVEQHQGAVGAEVAQVQERAAAVTTGVARVAAGRAVLEDGQLVQAVHQVGGGGFQQLLRADHGQRGRRRGGILQNARTGDGHRFGGTFSNGLRIGGSGHCQAAGRSKSQDARETRSKIHVIFPCRVSCSFASSLADSWGGKIVERGLEVKHSFCHIPAYGSIYASVRVSFLRESNWGVTQITRLTFHNAKRRDVNTHAGKYEVRRDSLTKRVAIISPGIGPTRHRVSLKSRPAPAKASMVPWNIGTRLLSAMVAAKSPMETPCAPERRRKAATNSGRIYQ